MELRPEDLKTDTYRAPDQTNRWVWAPDRGVRITHLPTGIQAECHEHRSQHRNKVDAYDKLIDLVGKHIARQLVYAEAQAKLMPGPAMMPEGQVKQLIARFFTETRINRGAIRGGQKPAVVLHAIINEVYAQGCRNGIYDPGLHNAALK